MTSPFTSSVTKGMATDIIYVERLPGAGNEWRATHYWPSGWIERIRLTADDEAEAMRLARQLLVFPTEEP